MITTEPPIDREAPGVVVSLFRFWRSSVLIVALLAAIAFGVSLLLPKSYVATTRLGLTDPRAVNIFATTGSLPADFERYTDRQVQLIGTRATLERVTELVDDVTVTQLVGRVEASSGAVGLVSIKAKAGSPERAQQIADAVAEAYGDTVQEATTEARDAQIGALAAAGVPLTEKIETAQDQIAEGDDDPSLAEEVRLAQQALAELDQRVNEVTVYASALNDGIDFVDGARQPTSPSEPQPVRNAGVAALVGLLVAGAVAWIRADRHQAADEGLVAEQLLGAPMLGSVPELAAGDDMVALSDSSSAAAEAYQFVTASLQHLPLWGILLVTSAGRRDGKTVTAASMAAAAARDGTKVILIDADARSHGLTRRLLGASGQLVQGITDVADGRARWEDVVRPLALSDGTLPFVPAGRSEASDLSSLYRTEGMAEALTRLRDEYDLVVVDCPALLAVADVASLASHADGIVLVVSRGTPLKALEAVRQRLRLMPAPLAGYVFTRAESEDNGMAAYGSSFELPWHLVPSRRQRGSRRRGDSLPVVTGNGSGAASSHHADADPGRRD